MRPAMTQETTSDHPALERARAKAAAAQGRVDSIRAKMEKARFELRVAQEVLTQLTEALGEDAAPVQAPPQPKRGRRDLIRKNLRATKEQQQARVAALRKALAEAGGPMRTASLVERAMELLPDDVHAESRNLQEILRRYDAEFRNVRKGLWALAESNGRIPSTSGESGV